MSEIFDQTFHKIRMTWHLHWRPPFRALSHELMSPVNDAVSGSRFFSERKRISECPPPTRLPAAAPAVLSLRPVLLRWPGAVHGPRGAGHEAAHKDDGDTRLLRLS